MFGNCLYYTLYLCQTKPQHMEQNEAIEVRLKIASELEKLLQNYVTSKNVSDELANIWATASDELSEAIMSIIDSQK